MASKAFLIAILVAFVVAPTTLATDHVVGDENGWRLGVNYTAWAEGKVFYVGDTLTFVYAQAFHNVVTVNGSEFDPCSSTATGKALASGHDVITLTAPGKKWYICGIGDHCTRGMRLAIAPLIRWST